MNTFVFSVTHFHKYKDAITKKTEYEKNVYQNCYFGNESSQLTADNSTKNSSSFVCRVPGKADILPGDVIVKGEIPDVIEDIAGHREADLVNKYKGNAFFVKSVSDNTLLEYFPHTRASGGV